MSEENGIAEEVKEINKSKKCTKNCENCKKCPNLKAESTQTEPGKGGRISVTKNTGLQKQSREDEK